MTLPDDVQEIADQSQQEGLISESAVEDSDEAADTDRQAAIRAGYEALDGGDLQNVLSVRDDHLAAILHGLDEAGELDRVVEAAAAERGLDAEFDGAGRSPALAHLAKAGLATVDQSILEDALEAHRQYQAQRVDTI